ncbi:Prefoldin alpha subunit [Mycena olivaceomarginata]|nr:Prefoldin alpha subunit [Mycena olivaceomarginata]
MAVYYSNITDLGLPRLADVRRQLEEELNHLTSSFAQLKQAQANFPCACLFAACIENVAEIGLANRSKTILVPLTNSFYVPGNLSDPDHVIVEVGTGYFVQQTRAQAVKHYTAKVEQDTISKKQDNVNSVIGSMQAKLQQQPAS